MSLLGLSQRSSGNYVFCHRKVIRMEGFAVFPQQARIAFGVLTSSERDKKEYSTSGHVVIGKLI